MQDPHGVALPVRGHTPDKTDRMQGLMRGIDWQSGMLTVDFLSSCSSVRGEIPAEASAMAGGE